jgi:hypothetical protein
MLHYFYDLPIVHAAIVHSYFMHEERKQKPQKIKIITNRRSVLTIQFYDSFVMHVNIVMTIELVEHHCVVFYSRPRERIVKFYDASEHITHGYCLARSS